MAVSIHYSVVPTFHDTGFFLLLAIIFADRVDLLSFVPSLQVDGVDRVLAAGDSVVVLPHSVHYVHPEGSFLSQVVCVNCGGPDDKFVVEADEEKAKKKKSEVRARWNRRFSFMKDMIKTKIASIFVSQIFLV